MDILKTSSLSIGYDDKAVVSDINVTLNEGDIIALIGPNGAGKSTLFKTFSTHIKPLGGKIELFGKDINLYINSPGGSVYAGLGIYDTMQFISSDVATICTGMAASMAAVLLVAGKEGKRSALTHSRVMIHQPLGGVQGQASDIEIEARDIQKLKKELYTIIANHSHTDYDKVWADSDRNYWMTADEAKEYGMIDNVLVKK